MNICIQRTSHLHTPYISESLTQPHIHGPHTQTTQQKKKGVKMWTTKNKRPKNNKRNIFERRKREENRGMRERKKRRKKRVWCFAFVFFFGGVTRWYTTSPFWPGRDGPQLRARCDTRHTRCICHSTGRPRCTRRGLCRTGGLAPPAL